MPSTLEPRVNTNSAGRSAQDAAGAAAADKTANAQNAANGRARHQAALSKPDATGLQAYIPEKAIATAIPDSARAAAHTGAAEDAVNAALNELFPGGLHENIGHRPEHRAGSIDLRPHEAAERKPFKDLGPLDKMYTWSLADHDWGTRQGAWEAIKKGLGRAFIVGAALELAVRAAYTIKYKAVKEDFSRIDSRDGQPDINGNFYCEQQRDKRLNFVYAMNACSGYERFRTKGEHAYAKGLEHHIADADLRTKVLYLQDRYKTGDPVTFGPRYIEKNEETVHLQEPHVHEARKHACEQALSQAGGHGVMAMFEDAKGKVTSVSLRQDEDKNWVLLDPARTALDEKHGEQKAVNPTGYIEDMLRKSNIRACSVVPILGEREPYHDLFQTKAEPAADPSREDARVVTDKDPSEFDSRNGLEENGDFFCERQRDKRLNFIHAMNACSGYERFNTADKERYTDKRLGYLAAKDSSELIDILKIRYATGGILTREGTCISVEDEETEYADVEAMKRDWEQCCKQALSEAGQQGVMVMLEDKNGKVTSVNLHRADNATWVLLDPAGPPLGKHQGQEDAFDPIGYIENMLENPTIQSCSVVPIKGDAEPLYDPFWVEADPSYYLLQGEAEPQHYLSEKGPGSLYDRDFSKLETPDGPDENGDFFCEQQRDVRLSHLHAFDALAGRRITQAHTLTEEEKKKKGAMDLSDIVDEARTYFETGDLLRIRSDTTEGVDFSVDSIYDFGGSHIAHQKDYDRFLAAIAHVSGRTHTVAIRKYADGWKLLDPGGAILDERKRKDGQPFISAERYVVHHAYHHALEDCLILPIGPLKPRFAEPRVDAHQPDKAHDLT